MSLKRLVPFLILAVALIGGLTATTFLTLFFIPALYTYFAKIKTGGKTGSR